MDDDVDLSQKNKHAIQAKASGIELKDRAELCMRLAENAQRRFEERRQYEWKICFGIWTSLAAASGLALSSTSWHPTSAEVIASIVIAIAVCFTFWRWFVSWVHGAHQFDKDVRNFWFDRVREMLEPIGDKPPEPNSPGYDPAWRHPVGIGQIVITIVFAILLVGSVGSKAASDGKTSSSEIVIKGRNESAVIVRPGAK